MPYNPRKEGVQKQTPWERFRRRLRLRCEHWRRWF
jgi:hypothetical protein